MTIRTDDPHTLGVIQQDGVTIDLVRFDFYSEDSLAWNAMADAELERSGWVRTGEWEHNVAPVRRETNGL